MKAARSTTRDLCAAIVFGLLSGVTACASSSPAVPGSAGASFAPSFSDRPALRLHDRLERDVQPFVVQAADGVEHEHPFLGGFDVPRPQRVDIDGDGDLDLFVQERTGRLIFLENVGGPTTPRFEWRTDFYEELDIGEWGRFFDVDHDGDLDLLAEERFSYIRLFRNDGDVTTPRFVLAADTLLDGEGRPIFADRQNIASLADVDCDGRVDLFLGRVDGTVARYEETAIRDGLPVYDLVTDRFEDIEIVAALSQPGAPTLHGANSMFFADGDGDGDLDLFWGDYFEPGILFIENFGSCQRPDLRSIPVPAPAQETILTSGYNAPYLVDEDGDGDLDLFIGVLGGAFNPNRTSSDNLHLYLQGADGRFAQVTPRYLDQIDIGSESVPAFTDLDGDGDLDMVVGNRLDPGALSAARLYVWENTGDRRTPAFALRDTVALGDGYHFAPRFADLDGDGRDELLLGTWNDDVRWFRDTARRTVATSSQTGWVTPEWIEVLDGPLVELPRGSHAVPAVGDLDGDGLLDLLVGESSGEINFFRNLGSLSEPRFELVTEALDGIDVGRRSHPVLLDIDGDGDLDLLLGREDAGVELHLNIGSPQAPSFAPQPSAGAASAGVTSAVAQPVLELFERDLLPLSAPAFVDLDGDGGLDLVSGGMSGGLIFFRNARVRR